MAGGRGGATGAARASQGGGGGGGGGGGRGRRGGAVRARARGRGGGGVGSGEEEGAHPSLSFSESAMSHRPAHGEEGKDGREDGDAAQPVASRGRLPARRGRAR